MPSDHPEHNSFITLKDVEDALPQAPIPMKYLDLIAAIFPGSFVAMCSCIALRALWSVRKKNSPQPDKWSMSVLMVWSKIMISVFFLFTLKGILGAVTTVPDSSGWEVCKTRLHTEGLEWMRENHSFWEMFVVDYDWMYNYHHPLRYCSDMLYSGHTFVVTIFALGLYELVTMASGHRHLSPKGKATVLALISFIAISEQAFEILAVEAAHFHYSMDVIMAVVMSFLLYTNGVIAIAAKRWADVGLRGLLDTNQWFSSDRRSLGLLRLSKEVEVPPALAEALDQHVDHLVSRGDVLIPWCCFPCCCLAGREHIYSDIMVDKLIADYALNNAHKYAVTDPVYPKQVNMTDTLCPEDAKHSGNIYRYVHAHLASGMHVEEGIDSSFLPAKSR